MESAVYALCALTSIVCAVLLGRSFAATRARLLLWATLCFTGLAFGIFAVNRFVLALLEEDDEARPYVYLLRLLAFLVIIAAIVDKNRAREAA